MTRRFRVLPLSCLLAGCVLFAAGAARAQVAKQGNDVLSSLAFQSERLSVSEPIESLDGIEYRRLDVTDASGWSALVGELWVPITSWPASISWGTSLLPIAPLAPATRTRIVPPFVFGHIPRLRRVYREDTPGRRNVT